ncbi:MAG: PqqD family protein [Tenuifilaceae bacterium]|jgi:hypothetical protein|nr:PqqD family protein [Tenuifilaceae bacterium]
MTLKEIFKLKPRFVTRQVGNELVLVPIETNVANMNELFTMNSTASLIWNSINDSNTEEDIVNLLVKEFDIDRETALVDLTSFTESIGKVMR